MEAQKPAEGILQINDYGMSKSYKVQCQCGSDDHNHYVYIEADDFGVTVTTYTNETSDYWTEAVRKRHDIENDFLQKLHWVAVDFVNGFVTRVKLTWQLWTKGYIKYQGDVMMSEQTALNYAETLKAAAADVKVFRDERNRQRTS